MANIKTKAPVLRIRGIARYPKTDRGYTYSSEQRKSVPDDDGKLSIDVIVDGEASKKYEAQIAAFAKEAGLKRYKNSPFAPEVDKETDEETGNQVYKAWNWAKTKDGKVKRMYHADSRGNPLGRDFRLTSGSEVIISVRPSSYEGLGGGVNLYLDGVQVVRYREFDNSPRFDVVEDGDFIADASDDDDAASFADVSEDAAVGTEDATDF